MPGINKSRDELPWLYYPRSNSVRVINSHFGGGGSLAVNGKTPIAAWVPSLDTAGNGTTALTDLIGSNDGTLTNMDAATDWVSDTDAGGVRALDFDGINDAVIASASSLSSTQGSVSMWVKPDAWAGNATIFSMRSTDNFEALRNSSSLLWRFGDGGSGWSVTLPSTGSWSHLVFTYDNSSEINYYLNSSGSSSPRSYSAIDVAGDLVIGNLDGSNLPFDGRIDDIRIFDSVLDASDVAYLYNSGSGRGRTS